jgi:toxin ParE1/3/4
LAHADLVEIWDYTATTWSLEQAMIYEDKILDACEAIASDPARGDDISDLRPGYRLWRVGRHFIVYRSCDQGIDVMRILHQARDLPRHL